MIIVWKQLYIHEPEEQINDLLPSVQRWALASAFNEYNIRKFKAVFSYSSNINNNNDSHGDSQLNQSQTALFMASTLRIDWFAWFMSFGCSKL